MADSDQRFRAMGRFALAAIRPMGTRIDLVIDLLGLPAAGAIAAALGGSRVWAAVGVLAWLLVLAVWAGTRLQRQRDRPVNLVLRDASIVQNEYFRFMDDQEHYDIVLGVNAEFINRGHRPVSLAFDIQYGAWVIDPGYYNLFFQLASEYSGMTVLPHALPNPLHLGGVGEMLSNRRGTIAVSLRQENLEERGISLEAVVAGGELVAVDRFSAADVEVRISLSEIANAGRAEVRR